MAQPIRVKLFTGAPEAKSMNWSQEYLTVPLLPSFAAESVPEEALATSNAYAAPRWRLLTFDNDIVPPRHIQSPIQPRPLTSSAQDSFDGNETSFLDTRNVSFVTSDASDNNTPALAEGDDMLTQFYEHSIAIHEAIPSSQIPGAQSSNSTSFVTASSDLSESILDLPDHPSLINTKSLPTITPLNPLASIPNAAYLRSIAPQTMTVNLIVGIISLPPARTIQPRRGGRELELIEMIVADETKAGFGINLWLPSTASQTSNLRTMVGMLRPQDVIMARNVALSSFRNNVYGQSLRKDMTKLDLMYRNLVDKRDREGWYSARELAEAAGADVQAVKVRKVKEWVMQFVGGRTTEAHRHVRGADKSGVAGVVLPDDTQ